MKAGSHLSNRGAYLTIREINQVSNKHVRMLRLNAVIIQAGWGKVSKVEGYDHISTAFDRSSQDMAIIWVRQGQSIDKWLITGNQAVEHARIYAHTRACQL
jgi:hypothetical protein